MSSMELDRNDMADYTEKVLLFWRSNAPKFRACGRLASMEPSSAAVEHFFSLCNHMFGDFPAERARRLRARLAHAAREHAIPPLGLNVLFLGRGRIYGDCQPCGPQFVCGGHLYYMHMHMCLKGCPRGLLVKKWLETSFLFSEIP